MRRCVAGYSAGRIINPRTARSQMIGGIIWGYGRAMLEESARDPRYGRYLSKNLSGVMLPVNADIPRAIDVFFVDEHDPHASTIGARGIGELGEVGVAAAITNALFHATGKRVRRLPVRIDALMA
jgi:xanthine dehydrogenase YagR molybdenum-binding subunit